MGSGGDSSTNAGTNTNGNTTIGGGATGVTTTGDPPVTTTGGGGFVSECVPGIPATTQVPRMKNRQYDRVLQDLLGVTSATSVTGPPSNLLVPDFEGSLTDIAWNSYQVAAEEVAAQVMAGTNRASFLACDPATAGCFEQTIREFGRKAFRRPLTEEEVDSYMRLTALDPPGMPDEIAEAILVALLVSPSFIMLPELGQESEGTSLKLTQHEVAARLSFLLWDSVPDKDLSTAADTGQLATKEQILLQAQRMIADRAKTAPVVAAFHRTYLDIREGSRWGAREHSPERFPKFSSATVAPMLAELDAFFEEVAFGGGSFSDMFLSNVAFVNQTTAPLYGLEAADFGPDLTRVQLDGAQRPGFLTRVAFLSSYSSYDTTSPILRGAFITSRILGIELDDPPDGAINTPIPAGNYATQREAITALTSPPACARCHLTYINPPGFVLESFDAVGGLQALDPLGGAIDGTADVYLTEETAKTITTPFELMSEIAGGEQAKRNYAEYWVRFATGRLPNAQDACVTEALALKLTTDGYTILDVLGDLTQADSFRLRSVGN